MNLFDRNVCPPGVEGPCRVTTGVRWDESTQSPYFNFVSGDKASVQLWQMWFDDAKSSAIKYAAARRLGVRGVGPYRWDQLDYNGSVTGNPRAPAESKEMWEAFDSFS